MIAQWLDRRRRDRLSHPLSHRMTHTPEAIRKRLGGPQKHNYLRDFIYGGIDGSVTTFAVVAGVAGAGLAPRIVVIMGMANLFADGFSMAASNYLGTRAEEQVIERARLTETAHISLFPEGEREEVRQIFINKGFDGDDLARAVEIITSDINRWVDTMVRDELGMSLEIRSPARAAWATFAAFCIFGLVPLLPFLAQFLGFAGAGGHFGVSTLLTGAAIFGVGAFKSQFVEQHWLAAGSETLLVGGGAAALAYWVGILLAGIGAG